MAIRGSRLKAIKASGRKLKDYRSNAKVRGHEWHLEDSDFFKIISLKCYYCGQEPRPQVLTVKGERRVSREVFNGLDRLDPKVGYTVKNCVPCCKLCNFAKGIFTEEEFLEHINKILKYRRSL